MNTLRDPGGNRADWSEISVVVRSLSALLGRYKEHAAGMAWLETRLRALELGDDGARLDAISELNKIVLGMGGLMDINLRDGSSEEAQRANDELWSLADRLYQLTKSGENRPE